MERTRHWYNRFGVEEPFPWLLTMIITIPIALLLWLAAAITVVEVADGRIDFGI